MPQKAKALAIPSKAALPLPPPAAGSPDLGPGFGGLLPAALRALLSRVTSGAARFGGSGGTPFSRTRAPGRSPAVSGPSRFFSPSPASPGWAPASRFPSRRVSRFGLGLASGPPAGHPPNGPKRDFAVSGPRAGASPRLRFVASARAGADPAVGVRAPLAAQSQSRAGRARRPPETRDLRRKIFFRLARAAPALRFASSRFPFTRRAARAPAGNEPIFGQSFALRLARAAPAQRCASLPLAFSVFGRAPPPEGFEPQGARQKFCESFVLVDHWIFAPRGGRFSHSFRPRGWAPWPRGRLRAETLATKFARVLSLSTARFLPRAGALFGFFAGARMGAVARAAFQPKDIAVPGR